MYYNNIGDNMNNNERIIKYNEILINYLNDLVNQLNPDNSLISDLINNATTNFKSQLANENLDIADSGVKTLMANAFNEYIKILKTHFDNSNIHQIDLSHAENEDINFEVNENTTNLTNAVNNMDKIPEYKNLTDRIRITLMNYFVQNFSSKEDIETISERIINDCIITCFNTLAVNKISEFYTNTLPNMISIGDDIIYVKPITQEDIEVINLQVNDERDAFILDTMNVEIKEDFVDGVVTLEITDAMGKTEKLVGREAMEKLISYNQLFEASRPGKKVDISKWEHLIDKMYEEDNISNTQPTISNTNVISSNNLPNNIEMSNVSNNDNINSNIDPNLNNINNNLEQINPAIYTNDTHNNINNNINVNFNDNNNNSELNNMINILNQDNNENVLIDNQPNLILPIETEEEISSENEIEDLLNIMNNSMDNNTPSVNDTTTDNNQINNIDNINNNPPIENNSFISNNIDIANDSSFLNNNVEKTSFVTVNNDENDMMERTQNNEINELKSTIGLQQDVISSSENNSFSFIPQYNHPNQERNDYIKRIKETDIEEDLDNQGLLYLKITEPTGREQIYTGRDAVNMIKYYNEIYLRANPDKTVDTSLIDKFSE